MKPQNSSKAPLKEGASPAERSSAGVSPARFLPADANVAIRNRGHLPHWEVERSTYFVTFRLADSLPNEVLQKLRFDREDIPSTAAQKGRNISESEQHRLLELQTDRIEQSLDAGAGACWLRKETIAALVANSLRQFDGTRHRLFAWAIMPNHVHVVFQTLGEFALPGVLHSWKSFSAKEGNKPLHRSGEFWQREYYDRLVRDEVEFFRLVQYVVDNPKRAGLRNWLWVWQMKNVG